MAWYWWALIAVGVIVVITLATRGRRKQAEIAARDEFMAPFARKREIGQGVDRELAKVVELILALPMVPPSAEHGGTVSQADLPEAIADYMRSAGVLGASTDTKMLHVVTAPTCITA